MRIVDVSDFYAPRGGGVRTYVDAKIEFASRNGHEVFVVAPGAEDRFERRAGGGVLWVRSPTFPFDPRYRSFRGMAAVRGAIDSARADVVEASSITNGARAVARHRTVLPKALVFHQDPVAVYGHTLLDRFLSPASIDRLARPYWRRLASLAERFDVTVTAAPWLATRLAEQGIPRVRAVPFGSRDLAAPSGARDEARRAHLLERCGLPPDATLLVAISRHHPEKRIGTLLEGVRLARARGHRIGLVLLGDGPLRSWIERRARDVGGVDVRGFVADAGEIARTLACADLFVHGSAAETYGLVVAEAIGVGVPMVVPDRGGAAHLARGPFAELYRPGEPEALARALDRMLRRSPEMRRHGLIAARSAIRSLDEHFAELVGAYEELLERRRAALAA